MIQPLKEISRAMRVEISRYKRNRQALPSLASALDIAVSEFETYDHEYAADLRRCWGTIENMNALILADDEEGLLRPEEVDDQRHDYVLEEVEAILRILNRFHHESDL